MKNAHIMLKMAAKCKNYARNWGLCFSFWIMLFDADYAKNYASIMYQCLLVTMDHFITCTCKSTWAQSRHVILSPQSGTGKNGNGFRSPGKTILVAIESMNHERSRQHHPRSSPAAVHTQRHFVTSHLSLSLLLSLSLSLSLSFFSLDHATQERTSRAKISVTFVFIPIRFTLVRR